MNQLQASDSRMQSLRSHLHSHEIPTFLMQGEPRQVVTANQAACKLFNKDLAQVEGFRGGQVFDCIHSFSEASCGKDPNCEDCKIKNAVVDTFNTGKSHNNVYTILDIKKDGTTNPYELQISTEKTGNYALMKILKYERRN